MTTERLTAWGVDVGLGATTICWLDGNGTHDFRSCTPAGPEAHDVDRLMELRDLLGTAGMSLPAPDLVVIERPTGKFPKPLLVMAAGVVCVTLRELTGAPTFLCAVAEWKKATVGKGNATKDECLGWAVGQGADVDDYDRADAYGIARFALASARSEAA